MSEENTKLNEMKVPDGTLVKAAYQFENNMVLTFGYDEQQIPSLQGAFSEHLEEKIKKYSDEETSWSGF